MDKIACVTIAEKESARIHPKQWEFVLKSRNWTENEKDSILALLVVEIAYMSDFIKGYEPLWRFEDMTKI